MCSLRMLRKVSAMRPLVLVQALSLAVLAHRTRSPSPPCMRSTALLGSSYVCSRASLCWTSDRVCEGVGEAWMQVQDHAAGLVVALLDPQPGEAVLDACAAPGGKALYAAARMRGRVSLISWVFSPDPLCLAVMTALDGLHLTRFLQHGLAVPDSLHLVTARVLLSTLCWPPRVSSTDRCKRELFAVAESMK